MAVLRALAYAWAFPYTAIGIAAGLVLILFGGTVRVCDGILEFGGGALGRVAGRLRPPFCFCAITLGHAVVGVDHETLAEVRAHEHVHVRQYERWGPVFVPAYLASSLVQWLLGRRPYRDNRFEREAYAQAGK
jgi:hypothetical protein